MKKYLLLIPSLLFPYSLLFALYCIYSGFLMDTLVWNSPLIVLLYLFILFAASLSCNAVFLVLSISKKWKPRSISLANLLVRLLQIPAYSMIFVLGILLFLSIFTYAASIFFVFFDCVSIFLSGLIGAASIIRCYGSGRCSKSFAIVNGVLQFVFCVDIISAIIIFAKCRKKTDQMKLDGIKHA